MCTVNSWEVFTGYAQHRTTGEDIGCLHAPLELCSLPLGLTSCDMDCVTTSNRNERNLNTKTHGNAMVPDNIKEFSYSQMLLKM